MADKTRDFFILVLVNLMWAMQFPAAKIATAQLGPITVTALTVVAATLLLAPFLLYSRRGAQATNPSERRSLPRAILDFAVIAIAGALVAQLFLTWGVQRSLASNASIITLTIPVLCAILAAVLLGERMTPLRWISFVLAIAGVLAVSDVDWRSAQILHGPYLVGNLLILLSCGGSAFYNVFSKKLLRKYDPLEILVYSFAASDLILVPMMLKYEPLWWSSLGSSELKVWVSLAVISVFTLGLAMILFLRVLQRLDATQAILSVYLLPIFGVFISTLTVREKVTLRLLMGAILVFAGTFLITVYEERKRVMISSLDAANRRSD